MHFFLSNHPTSKRWVALCVSRCHYSMYLCHTNQIVLCQDHSGTIRISNWYKWTILNVPPKPKDSNSRYSYSTFNSELFLGDSLHFAKCNLSTQFPLVVSKSLQALQLTCAHSALSIPQCEDFRTSLGNGVALLWRHLSKHDMKKIPWLQWPKLFGGFWPDSPRFQNVASLLVKLASGLTVKHTNTSIEHNPHNKSLLDSNGKLRRIKVWNTVHTVDGRNPTWDGAKTL